MRMPPISQADATQKTKPSFIHPYYRKVRWLEAIILCVVFSADVIALSYYQTGVLTHPVLAITVLFLYASCTVIQTRSSSFSKIVPFLQIALTALGCATGPARFYQWLFVPVIVRACFFWTRKQVVALSSGCILLFGLVYYVTFRERQGLTDGSILDNALPALLFAHSLQLSVLLFSALLVTFSLLAEYESRMRAEKLAAEIEEIARKLERTEIGRDIHDSLGHSLTTLNLHLTLAEKVFTSDPEKSRSSLQLARDFARQSIADVRFALQALHSDKLRMDEAVTRLVEDLEKVREIRVVTRMDWPALNTEQAHHLYCIIRECLNNTQKYAQANEVSIDAKPDGAMLTVIVKDNGTGFDATEQINGYGLKGIAERVQHLHGTCKIESTPGAGTSVSIQIPLLSS